MLLVHGNCSSADFWRPLLRHLPPTLRIVAPDMRGYGRSAAAPVDATRGLRDFADDVAAVLDAKPPITWLRGDKDAIVSDTSFFDLAYLGVPRRRPRLARRAGMPAAADGGPDPRDARPLRGGRRHVHRGGVRELRPLTTRRAPRRLRRSTAETVTAAVDVFRVYGTL